MDTSIVCVLVHVPPKISHQTLGMEPNGISMVQTSPAPIHYKNKTKQIEKSVNIFAHDGNRLNFGEKYIGRIWQQ